MAFCATAAIGFLMPRLILDQIGQQMLGVWDLSWSILVFVSASSIGTGSAVSHFLARLRNAKVQGRQIFVTGLYLQGLLACGIAISFWFALTFLAEYFVSEFSSLQLADISKITTTVCFTVVVAMLGEIAHSAFVGSHQSRRSEYINVSHDVTLALCMITSLSLGFGILGLATATLIVRVLFELVRFAAAWSVLEHFSLNITLFQPQLTRRLLRYSIKSSFYGVQELVVYQTIRFSFFLIAGPVVFAAFSRYSTLARQINRLVDRLVISVPALASDIVRHDEISQIRDVYRYGTQTNLMLTLPVLVIFAVFGDQLVKLWMGNAFVIPNLAIVFCAACLLHSQYAVSEKILRGANSHGKISLVCISTSSVCLLLLFLLDVSFTPYTAAASIGGIMLICVHIPVILFTWHRLQMNAWRQLVDLYCRPFFANVLYFVALIQLPHIFANGRVVTGLLLLLLASALLVYYYWFWVCDHRLRRRIKTAFPQFVTS